MNNDFLPADYNLPQGQNKYLKFQDGANKFRIMSKSVVGWLDWNDKTPVRTKECPIQLFNPGKPAKHFWAFIVWDYQAKTIKILEVTQSTIQQGIMALFKDEDWGNPAQYGLTVTKTGKDMETKYVVIPGMKSDVGDDIKLSYDSTFINLEALFSGEDPFAVDKIKA